MLWHDAIGIQVVRGVQQAILIITELPEPTVAVEAQDPAHLAGHMVVIDVLRIGTAAHGTHATLRFDDLVDLRRADSIPTFEVVVPTSSVQPVLALLAARVVAGLAVRVPAITGISIARELVERLPLSSVRTPLHARDRTRRV